MQDEEKIVEVFQYKDRESWVQAIQKSPLDTWIKKRDLGGGKSSKFIPLAIQQALADKLFREFDVVDEKYDVVVNEILCTVKIQILPDYPHSEYRRITGTAAKPIQTKSGSTPASFPSGKYANALEYNAPSARAAAIANALTTFGNIFGRNLNRDMNSNFSFIRNKEENEQGK